MSDDTTQSPDALPVPPVDDTRADTRPPQPNERDEERERTATKRDVRSERATLTKKIDVQRTAQEISDLAREFGAQRSADMTRATTVIASDVAREIATLQRDDVPTREKILMGLRAVAAVSGALWVGKQFNRLWTSLFGSGFISTMGKIGVGVGALFTGAHFIARDTSPRAEGQPETPFALAKPFEIDGMKLRLWVHAEGLIPELRVTANTKSYKLQMNPASAQLLRFLSLTSQSGYVELATGQRIARTEITRIARALSLSSEPTVSGNVAIEQPDGSGGYTSSSIHYVFERLPSPSL